jgi:hypothetical protein
MDRKTITGAVFAAAVGAMFLSTPVLAQTSSGNSASADKVKCVGGNSCKGQSSCKSASNGCMGQNSCKGKGWVMATSAKMCTDKGGKPEKAPTNAM